MRKTKTINAWAIMSGKDIERPFIGDFMIYRTEKEAKLFKDEIESLSNYKIVPVKIIL